MKSKAMRRIRDDTVQSNIYGKGEKWEMADK